MQNRRSLSGTITKGEKKPLANRPEHTHTQQRERRGSEAWVEQTLGPFICFSVYIYSEAPLPKCERPRRNPLPEKTALRCAEEWGTSKGGLHRSALCEVSLGYDRLVPTLAGLLTVAKRRPKTTKRDCHSNALRQGQLFGGEGARLGGGGEQHRETIEPRLAACDWNPELTFAFLGINWNGWYRFDGNAARSSTVRRWD